MKNKLYSKKNMYLSVVWAVFHLRGPASALVGCCGPSWAFVDKLYIYKKYIKKTNLPMAQTTCLASFGPFSPFVGFLFPLHWPSLAAVGLCGPSWLSSTPKRGVVGVVQLAKLYSKKKHSHWHM